MLNFTEQKPLSVKDYVIQEIRSKEPSFERIRPSQGGQILLMSHLRKQARGAFSVFFNFGSSIEESGDYGKAHFLEHLIAKKINKDPDFLIKQEKGAWEHSYLTYKELMLFYVVAPSYGPLNHKSETSITAAANKIEEALFNLSYNKSNFEIEKRRILMEIVRDTERFELNTIEELRYRGTGYEHSILGLKEEVSSYTLDDIIDFSNKHLTRENCNICIECDDIGDTKEELLENANRILCNLPSSSVNTQILEPKARVNPDILNKAILVSDRRFSHAKMYFTYSLSSGGHRENILNNWINSYLQKNLHEYISNELGEEYGVNLQEFQYRGDYLGYISLYVSYNNIEKLISIIRGQMEDLIQNGIPLSYIENRKEKDINGLYSNDRSSYDIFLNLIRFKDLEFYTSEESINIIQEFSPEIFKNYAKDYLVPENCTIIVFASEEMGKEIQFAVPNIAPIEAL